jgi:hypothetical protein
MDVLASLFGGSDPVVAGRLSLAYQDLPEVPTALARYAPATQELDLSHNTLIVRTQTE